MPVQPVFAAFSFMCKIVRKCHRLKPDSGIQKEENRIYIEKGHKHVSENASILPLFTFLSSIVINCKITDRWKDQEKYRRQSEVTLVDLQSVPAYPSLCRSIHGQRQAFFILCMLSDSLCKEHGAGKQHMGSAHCRNNSLFLPVFPRAHRPCGYCDSFQSLSRLTYDLFQGAAVPLASRTIATTKTFFTFLADWKLQQSQGSGFDDFSFGISFLQKFVFYRDPPARSNEEPIASPLLR
jgi:hypothetical protein